MGKIILKDHIEFSKERCLSTVLFDSDKANVQLFCLEKGQEVPSQALQSQVIMIVISGQGVFSVGDKEYPAKMDSVVVCESLEPHGLKADEQMVVLVYTIPLP
ncbi:MAG: hypothetical protein MRJ65_01100 [Candidatus Brocadiaceae bacterium]|nr:hypothetical protein [Candidatus Brocadiaceae bacterium]